MNVCLFRLSALGDVTHVLAVVAAIRAQRPEWRLSWIIGPAEAKLLDGLEGVKFYRYRKSDGWRGALALRREILKDHPNGFDALLQMQLALRANLVSRCIPARRRIGFDAARSKELHGLVINERIPKGAETHVQDVLLQFLRPLGLTVPKREALRWPFPIPETARAEAQTLLASAGERKLLLLSPCASHSLRNWHAEGYAAVLHYAQRELGLLPVLIGGKSPVETAMCTQIRAELARLGVIDYLDLVGKDTLKSLLAILQRGSVLISPDSGPAHIAQALGTPVVGLYAATDANRSGPYRCLELCTHHYAAAALQFFGKPASSLRWGQKIERPGVMALIEVGEVCALVARAIR